MTVPKLNVRVHMLHKEQQAVKDMMQSLNIRMEVSTIHITLPLLIYGVQGIRYRLSENEDNGLDVLQMISNPQLTASEQQVLTQEYHSHGERIEVTKRNIMQGLCRHILQGEYWRIKGQEQAHLIELARKEASNIDKTCETMTELLCAKHRTASFDVCDWLIDAFKTVVECGKVRNDDSM